MTPTQADFNAAADWMDSHSAEWDKAITDKVRAGDLSFGEGLPEAFTRHRLAAEAAAFEKAAAYIEGKGGVIPGATVFISLITGSNQPCMSGDGRDHLHSHKRRQFDDATSTLATAIRKLAGEKHD